MDQGLGLGGIGLGGATLFGSSRILHDFYDRKGAGLCQYCTKPINSGKLSYRCKKCKYEIHEKCYNEADGSVFCHKNEVESEVENIGCDPEAQHIFEKSTFGKPTWCNYCSLFIWGLSKQGYRCVECGYNAHRGECHKLAMPSMCPSYVPDKEVRRKKDEGKGLVHIRLVAARHLANTDVVGKTDPYVILSTTYNTQIFKSSTKKNTLSPQWDQPFTFETPLPLRGELRLMILDSDTIGKDDFVGVLTVPLSNILEEPFDDWRQLDGEAKKRKGRPPGELRLVISAEVLQTGKAKNSDWGSHISGFVETRRRKKRKHKKSDRSHRRRKQSKDDIDTLETNEPKRETKTRPKSRGRDRKSVSLDEPLNFTNIEEIYIMGKELGVGGFSVVQKGTRKKDHLEVAIKILSKDSFISEEEQQIIENELNILDLIDHPNCLQIIDVFQTIENVYIVIELLPYGELFDLIVNTEEQFLDEYITATCIFDVLSGLQYLHDQMNICHRDIKLENILITADGHCKIVDFGTALVFDGFVEMIDSTGTPLYQSPEVLKCESFSFNTDIWATGIMMFMCLSGTPPYVDDDNPLLGVLNKEYENYPPEFDTVSTLGIDLLKKMLQIKKRKRWNAARCLAHVWFDTYRRDNIMDFLATQQR